ncbi:hypothetical protein RhiirA4_548356 [Rhizophagus irregularis]|uniref:Cas12f1-like TNB domain-containing protein n=1 Tax=Rhizophagus irregularis TaxID=588596 RepID=A0A2I1H755_9GLOM|nr:hypothetical protein RhiirA4_548356 [Rhizophagus irregularis]
MIIQNEAYTSKTCSWCGNIQKIGGLKMYKCKNCDIEIDDINGARGIFLRALLDGALILSGDHAGNTYSDDTCSIECRTNPGINIL